MKPRLKASRSAQAAGSVMEIWPVGGYAEHMPKGTAQQRIGQHWNNVGKHLDKALTQYAQSPERS